MFDAPVDHGKFLVGLRWWKEEGSWGQLGAYVFLQSPNCMTAWNLEILHVSKRHFLHGRDDDFLQILMLCVKGSLKRDIFRRTITLMLASPGVLLSLGVVFSMGKEGTSVKN